MSAIRVTFTRGNIMSEASAESPSRPAAPSSRGRVRYRQAPPPVSYANVFEVRGGIDEVLVTLGYGQSGRIRTEQQDGVANELLIDPTHRVALTPQAAKRLAAALAQSVSLMEARQPNQSTPQVSDAEAAAVQPVAADA